MTGEIVGIQGAGDDAVYLVQMTTSTGERRAHLESPIRCRLSDLDKAAPVLKESPVAEVEEPPIA